MEARIGSVRCETTPKEISFLDHRTVQLSVMLEYIRVLLGSAFDILGV